MSVRDKVCKKITMLQFPGCAREISSRKLGYSLGMGL